MPPVGSLNSAIIILLITMMKVDQVVGGLEYKYYYERQPVEVGNHYSDPNNRVLNDGYGTSDWISESNSVAFSRGTSDWKPHLVLRSSSIVTEIEIHYIVKEAWSKFAPLDITLKTSLHDNKWEHTHTFKLTDIPQWDGGHTITLPLPGSHCSRYILVDEISPKYQQSVITEITLQGVPCSVKRQNTVIPPTESTKEVHRLRGSAVDFIMLRR
eukprot:TRINITY_DN5185_c0_g2_i1.p1 TRINITY_DN5185_c0_g2~~TRINITY_DN5185_c0_g2_i1.p1  ORF type:complete len:213 (+),score=30.80 TRINITY_DN5185_c0_g2_i1:65-703(+)